jgi:hypothetical protein
MSTHDTSLQRTPLEPPCSPAYSAGHPEAVMPELTVGELLFGGPDKTVPRPYEDYV